MTDGAFTGVDRMPVPMGVIATTGETHPALSEDALLHISPDSEAAVASRTTKALAVEGRIEDPMDLSQAGWGVLFPADIDPAIVDALAPLIEQRRSQVGDDRFFKLFHQNSAVKPGQTAPQWAAARGVSLSAPVSPKRGVPYYLLIVGSPSQIPFEFQAQMDLQWAVGRLHFEAVGDYAAYAQKVVDYERGLAPQPKKRAVVWMPRNPLDLATAMLAGTMVPEFRGEAVPGDEPIGKSQAFELATYVGEGMGTKTMLMEIFRGTDGAPSLLFTGSHGAEWPSDDPMLQRERQGALVTQEWTRGQPLAEGHYFTGRDLPTDAAVHGLVMFLFACFGGGCPDKDSYYFNADGSNVRLAAEPMIAGLPQALLRRGALAIVAHVDRAFSYAFEDVMGSSQAQLLRTPLELLMRGRRVGLAMEPLNQQWASLAAQLGVLLGGNAPGDPRPRPPVLANLYIARDDARNYMVLGDPAVRLRTEAMV